MFKLILFANIQNSSFVLIIIQNFKKINELILLLFDSFEIVTLYPLIVVYYSCCKHNIWIHLFFSSKKILQDRPICCPSIL